jgi:CP family cyanate transporter-like MFS transporter
VEVRAVPGERIVATPPTVRAHPITTFPAALPPAAEPGRTPGAPTPRSGEQRREPVDPDQEAKPRQILLLIGIVAVALNLRTAVTSLGAVLGEVTRAWGFSGLLAGLLTALPVAMFALVGAVVPTMTRRLGPERLVATAMLAAAAGLTVRALTGSVGLFVVGSGLALSGAAVGNVLMPVLVTGSGPSWPCSPHCHGWHSRAPTATRARRAPAGGR